MYDHIDHTEPHDKISISDLVKHILDFRIFLSNFSGTVFTSKTSFWSISLKI